MPFTRQLVGPAHGQTVSIFACEQLNVGGRPVDFSMMSSSIFYNQ